MTVETRVDTLRKYLEENGYVGLQAFSTPQYPIKENPVLVYHRDNIEVWYHDGILEIFGLTTSEFVSLGRDFILY